MLSDADIDAMTLDERRALMRRLEAKPQIPDRLVGRLHVIRRVRLGIMAACVVVLVPWTIYLAFALPTQYEAHNWRVAWVGFDVILIAAMTATAWLAWRMRQLVILASFTSGILLVIDAWFDVVTAAPDERPWSIASALLLELPLAFVLTYSARRLLRIVGQQRLSIEPGQRLREVPLRMPNELRR